MSVYKKTCETGLVYYGSTGNDIKIRENKGHKNCTCENFINPKMEVIEYINDPKLRYERELYYIRNFPCVNIDGKGFDRQKWIDNNKEKRRQYHLKSVEKCKVFEKFKCDNCGRETNKKHIKRHMKTAYCISKGNSVMMGPSVSPQV
jgi:hypothetical protein